MRKESDLRPPCSHSTIAYAGRHLRAAKEKESGHSAFVGRAHGKETGHSAFFGQATQAFPARFPQRLTGGFSGCPGPGWSLGVAERLAEPPPGLFWRG